VNVCGGFPAPADVSVTFSAYVFGARPARMDGFSDKVKACGVVPEVGDTVRKSGPPLTGAVATVKFNGVLELVTCTVCDAGVPVPSW